MSDEEKNLGKLVAVHPIASPVIQRAVFVAALSFAFFLGMMFLFYLRQSFLYFLLATAFLVLYLGMMASFITLRKKTIEVRENGISFKKARFLFTEITNITDGGTITLNDKRTIDIPTSLSNRDELIASIASKI